MKETKENTNELKKIKLNAIDSSKSSHCLSFNINQCIK